MARQRMLHPGFFRDSKLLTLSPLHRLLFAGLWGVADREGRLRDDPMDLKIELLPADACDVDAMLSDLARVGSIVRYRVGGLRYIWIPRFLKYQHPHKMEKPSDLPAQPEPQVEFQLELEKALGKPGAEGRSGRAVDGTDRAVTVTVTESVTDPEEIARSAPSPFAEAQRLCIDVYIQKRGCKYKWLGAQDSNALKRILTVATPQEAARMFGVGLDQTGFKETNTISQLDSKWNDLSRLRPNVPTLRSVPGPKPITEEERKRGIYEGQAK